MNALHSITFKGCAIVKNGPESRNDNERRGYLRLVSAFVELGAGPTGQKAWALHSELI
jgi:hypothetical protein